MGKYIVPLSIAFGSIVIASALMFYFWLVPKIREGVQMVNQNMASIYAETTEKHKDQYLLDAKEIKKLNIFETDYSRTGLDVADFLNPEIAKIKKKEAGGFLDIPQKVANAFVIEGDQWMSQRLVEHTKTLSIEWLTELEKYNYWSEEKFSEYEMILAHDKHHNFFEKPVEFPLIYLYYWAQVAWLKAIYLKGSSPQQSLRHLVKLLHSRGTIGSSLMAIKILALEVEVSDFHPNLVNGKSLTQMDIGRLNRFIYATSGILRSAIFSNKNYELFDQLEIGRCLAVDGAMPHFFMLYKPIFFHAWRDHYLRMTDYIKNENCGRRRFRAVWNEDQFTIKHMQGKDLGVVVSKHFAIQDKQKDYAFQSVDQQVSGQDVFELSKIPMIAKLFSTSLMSINSPDPWEYY